MLAAADVEAGEVLFEIPRTALLTQHNSSIAQLLNEEAAAVKSESGWVPLLLSLMHEYTNPLSPWRPYLDLVPDFSELDLPMFWTEDDRETLLRGTGVGEVINRDLTNITHEFDSIVQPFMLKHPKLFDVGVCDLSLYKKMVAFVMAYSFTEPHAMDDSDDDDDDDENEASTSSSPMMVPVADILNHVAKNNAHLDFGVNSLKMVSTRPIQEGEEVYNTYGELSNHNLIHMYGFTERYPNNHYDVVEIPVKHLFSAISEGDSMEPTLMANRLQQLEKVNILEELGSHIILEKDGIMNDQVVVTVLKLIYTSDEDFRLRIQQLQDDGWDEEDEDNDDLLTFENIPSLKQQWRGAFKRMAMKHCECFPRSLSEEEEYLTSGVSQRLLYCSQLRHGQLKLLHKLISACCCVS